MQKGELTIGIGQEDSHQVAIVGQEDELKQRLHQLVFSSFTCKVKDRSIMCYTHKKLWIIAEQSRSTPLTPGPV